MEDVGIDGGCWDRWRMLGSMEDAGIDGGCWDCKGLGVCKGQKYVFSVTSNHSKISFSYLAFIQITLTRW